MTIRDCYEACLIELNKVQAPSLLLDDFIYLFNKGLQQYVNKRYNLFETKQQLTDDLRVLTKTIHLTLSNNGPLQIENNSGVFDTSYRCELPLDYLHILNCICEFQEKNPKCSDCGIFQQGANKLDTTQWAHVIDNYYMRPSVKRPYYYIINISDPAKTDANGKDYMISNEAKKSVGQPKRYGNSVLPIMQIKCGHDPKYILKGVYIDYLRAPEYQIIDRTILDSPNDKSPIVEFPDYVIYEIINGIVTLMLENASDQRIQTNLAVNQSIA